MITRISLALFLALTTSSLIKADDPENKQASATQIDAPTAKKKALQWVDQYRKVQVLFHQEDLDRVRKDLADGSDEDALVWWEKSAQARAALDSPQWKDTQAWLREFLKVQAIFSDKEVDEFRSQAKEDVKKETPTDFKKILADVEQYRRKLAQGSANARELREHQLKVIDAFRKEEAAARVAAMSRAATTAVPNPVKPPVRSRPPRRPTGPLVDSLDVARWSVMRGFWRF